MNLLRIKNRGGVFIKDRMGQGEQPMKYRPQDFIIACDMDDTIEHLIPAWVKWLNSKHGYNVKPEDVTDWRVGLFFPTLSVNQVFEPLHMEEFWKTVEPMWDAVHYIELLIEEGFPFFIVTSSYPDTIVPKFTHVLYKYFPFIDKNNIKLKFRIT